MKTAALLVTAAALCAAAPAAARADPVDQAAATFTEAGLTVQAIPTDRARIVARAVTIAARYWGQRPAACDGALPPILEATAGMADATGGQVESDGATPLCGIALNDLMVEGYYPRWEMCQILVHEYGHELGLQHSADPGSIMAATPTFVPAGCVRMSDTTVMSRHGAHAARRHRPRNAKNAPRPLRATGHSRVLKGCAVRGQPANSEGYYERAASE